MNREHRVAFIGAGNMAEALVRGLLSAKLWPPDRIRVTDIRPERLDFFARELGVASASSNAEAVSWADVVVLAVKPQVMAEVLQEIRSAITPRHLAISIAAGLSTRWIESRLGDGVRVVRAMPNTPALVRRGVTAVCPGQAATEEDRQVAAAILGAVGRVVWLPEHLMDAVTAVSGSGPAYVFFLAEILLEAAERMELPPEAARELVTATLSGAAELLEQTGLPPAELRARVTSKGGTTEAALRVLTERGVFESFVEAILAARRRAQELSQA